MNKPIFDKKGLKLFFLMALFMPSIIFLFLRSSSMASGLLLIAILIIVAAFLIMCIKPRRFFIKRDCLLGILFLLLFLLGHFFISGFFVSLNQDVLRFFVSLILISIVILAAMVLSPSLIELPDTAVRNILNTLFLVLVVNALMSLTGINFFGVMSNKVTFLFNEPSHFALAAAPFLIFYVRSRSVAWIFFGSIFLWYSIYIQNMTMLIAVIMALLVGMAFRRAVFLLLCISIFSSIFIDANYFLSRLVFSVEDSNLSGLIFLQGWQNAYLALLDTHGWGCGFQQFGISSPTGEFTQRIEGLVHGESLNLFDGGTTASKLIGEFGVFGIIFVMILIFRSARAFLYIKKNKDISSLFLFAKCVEISLLIELLVRGIGYFSPSIFFCMIMYLSTKYKVESSSLSSSKLAV